MTTRLLAGLLLAASLTTDAGAFRQTALDLVAKNGGVTLTMPRDYSAAVEVSTVNGGLRSDFPVTVPDGRGRELRTTLGSGGPLIKVRTVNGGVRLNARARQCVRCDVTRPLDVW